MTVSIRRVRADEGMRLRTLRLVALADAPLAFGSTLERESAFGDDIWHERASDGAAGAARATFVAEHAGELVGLVTGLLEDRPTSDRATLVGMFVASSARRQGLGRALVDAVATWAQRQGAQHLHLWVTSTNEAAVALYARCGFAVTGQTQPLPHTPTLTELEMVRDLSI